MKSTQNLLLYMASWWSAVFLLSRNLHIEATVVLMAFVSLQFFLVMKWDRKLVIGSLLVGCIGYCADLLSWSIGIFSFSDSYPPLSMLMLWICFATTFPFGLSKFSKPLWLCVILGAIAGPATYWGVESFGILHFHEPQMRSLSFYAAIWGILFPGLFAIWKRYLGKNLISENI